MCRRRRRFALIALLTSIHGLSGLLDMYNSHSHDRVRTAASPFAGATIQGCPMHMYGAVVLRHGMNSHLVPIVLRLIGTPRMWSPLCTRAPQRENRTSPYRILCPLPSLGCYPPVPQVFEHPPCLRGLPWKKDLDVPERRSIPVVRRSPAEVHLYPLVAKREMVERTRCDRM